MAPAELIQLGEQIANLHRCRIEDALGSGGPPALRCGQAAVERLADDGGDRCTALPRECANPLVTFIVDENLQPVRQHAHTLACAYRAARCGPSGFLGGWDLAMAEQASGTQLCGGQPAGRRASVPDPADLHVPPADLRWIRDRPGDHRMPQLSRQRDCGQVGTAHGAPASAFHAA